MVRGGTREGPAYGSGDQREEHERMRSGGRTHGGRYEAVVQGPRMRILLEASTESEWVAQHLETLGHDVVVADPNYAPMYGQRSRHVKTDTWRR